ncbi:MAG: hypothetical protein HQL28_05060, partial [Candidatus Omnitrophica bacterium]|nr:hypothetical protein [Candidatus Omnitrophota bacterium]
MNKHINFDMSGNFIGDIVDYVSREYLDKGRALDRIAFVFEGKRPSLFLKKALSERIGRPYSAPISFSIEEFVKYVLLKKTDIADLPAMETYYTIYKTAKALKAGLVKKREKFSEFLPWAREAAAFIDLLDLEDIEPEKLSNIQASATIGFDVPDNINALLKNITLIRDAYHKTLLEKKMFSRGFKYLSAARAINEIKFDEFDVVIFAGFFFMHKTVSDIIGGVCGQGKGVLINNGDQGSGFRVQGSLSEVRRPACTLPDKTNDQRLTTNDQRSLRLYAAFDKHSQVCLAREILKNVDDLSDTVIVLPDPDSMIPLVSELGGQFGDFNVSLGYPLKRSSLYSLFEHVFRAQKTKKNGEYYSKDYLAALSQPIMKNLRIAENPAVTRIIVHKIEEALLGTESAGINNSIFLSLDDVLEDEKLFKALEAALNEAGEKIGEGAIKAILEKLHRLLFGLWENIESFRELAAALDEFLAEVIARSKLEEYPINIKIAQRLYSLKEEFENASFSAEHFEKEDIFKLFRGIVENEILA